MIELGKHTSALSIVREASYSLSCSSLNLLKSSRCLGTCLGISTDPGGKISSGEGSEGITIAS